jgi:hypothetical protein
MTFSAIIEVGVGLVLVFYILSQVSSSITSWIAKVTQLDARKLEEGLMDLFDDPKQLDNIMNHPWVRMLRPKKMNLIGDVIKEKFENWREGKRVTWIPNETFAKVLADVLAPGEDGLGDINDIRRAIGKLPAGALKSSLLGMVNKSVASVSEFRSNVEGWFDDAMASVSQVYKQNTKQIVLAVAFVLTFSLNVDAIAIVTSLWDAPTTRAIAAVRADEILQAEVPPEAQLQEIPDLVQSLEVIGIPLFWRADYLPQNTEEGLTKVAGLLITWIATAQGSPFWYDVLKRLRGRG